MDSPTVPDLQTAQDRLLQAYVPEARSRRVSWSGGETQTIEAGSGPPLLFVHGGFGQATEWIPLWPHLVRRHRLIAVDRPGHGLADPYDFRRCDVRELAARFLREILDALGLERVPLVGNSLGGRWAVELALRDPQRVSRLILVGAPAGSRARVPVLLLTLRWPFTRPLIRRRFQHADAESVRWFFDRVLVADAGRLSREFLVAKAAGQRRDFQSLLSFATRVMTWHSIHPALLLAPLWHRLQAPVHFIWGDGDAFDPPATGRAALSRIRAAADLTVIRGAGHLPWLDAPEAVADAIEQALSHVPQPVPDVTDSASGAGHRS